MGNMSALVKELLHDYVKGKLDTDTRITLMYAIEQLYRSKTFTRNEIVFLDYYLRGYSAEEIAIKSFVSTELVVNVLTRLLTAIEHTSGYLDSIFIQKVQHKYTARQITQLKGFLEKHGKQFTCDMI